MGISSDIRKLEPGRIVELFDFDLEVIGGDVRERQPAGDST